jgi:hypothetical protein
MRDWFISDERWWNTDEWIDRRFEWGYNATMWAIPVVPFIVGIGIGVLL